MLILCIVRYYLHFINIFCLAVNNISAMNIGHATSINSNIATPHGISRVKSFYQTT